MLSLKRSSHYHGNLKMEYNSFNGLGLATKNVCDISFKYRKKKTKVVFNIVVSLTNEDS